jgi:replicative DNA helicase Mcm
MLSRFDLVFALRDTINADKDRNVCEAILRARQGSEIATEYTKDEITKYIIYAKSKIGNISYSEDAIKILTDKFVKIRSANTDETIPITNRQMEGLSRIAEACAKLRLSEIVEAEDANVALGILDYYLNTMCMDPATGKYNTDMINGTENEGQKKTRIGLESFIRENYLELTFNHPKNYIIPEELEEKFKERTKSSDKDYAKAIEALLETDKKLLSINGGEFYKPVESMKPKGVLKSDDGKTI